MREELRDLWSYSIDDCDARVITTNGTVKASGRAVMGRGVAKQAKDRYIGIEKLLGMVLKTQGNHVEILIHKPLALVMFPVKHEWHELADLELIAQSARELVSFADVMGWKRVVLPRPGCGNGGLKWESQVRPILLSVLDDRFTVVTL